jgi:hypothetical protein
MRATAGKNFGPRPLHRGKCQWTLRMKQGARTQRANKQQTNNALMLISQQEAVSER